MRLSGTRAAGLAALGLLAAGWSAPPADDASRLALFEPVARFTWSALPCQPIVHIGADVAAGLSAESDPETCEVWIRPGLSAYEFCVTLAHEYGHLAGHVGDAPDDPIHDADPASLMHAAPPRAWPPCVSLAVTPLEVAVTARARRQLRGGGWRVKLIRSRYGRRLVVARRGARRVVWEVWGSRAAWEMARER
jgi:hypothetical protein